MIERIFSELYNYLHFKSTTNDVIQNHINIDNGYKYLTNDSLRGNENPVSNLYYDDSDGQNDHPYLSYVARLYDYISGSRDGKSSLHGVLDNQDEVKVLEHAIEVVLSRPERQYFDEQGSSLYPKFDLCPFCNNYQMKFEQSPRELKMMNSPLMTPRAFAIPNDADDRTLYLDIVFDLPRYMNMSSSSDVVFPSQMMQVSDYRDNLIGLRYVADNDGFSFDASSVSLMPHFKYNADITLDYKLIGYSTQPSSSVAKYPITKVFS